MTDREVFEKMMSWMGMSVDENATMENGNQIVCYKDDYAEMPIPNSPMSKLGYDEFHAGAEFDGSGRMIRGYIDSHVALTSRNYDTITDDMNKARPANEQT